MEVRTMQSAIYDGRGFGAVLLRADDLLECRRVAFGDEDSLRSIAHHSPGYQQLQPG